jgi:uncharacterized protein YjbJ (UPF0337 family)
MGAMTDKIKGKLKQVEGRLTGDKVRTAQGTAEKSKGDLEDGVSRVASKVRAKASEVKARTRASASRAKTRGR